MPWSDFGPRANTIRPYCIHCQHIAPIWQTLYEYYLTSKPVPAGAAVDAASTSMNSFTAYYDFHFGSLDCVAFGTACSNHNVGTFPQFLLYKDGKVVKRFEGDRNMKGLSDFIEESLETIRPGSRPINGPKLPEAEAKRSPDYEGPDAKEDDSKKQAKLTPEFLDEDESKSRSKKGSKAKESDTAKGYNTKAKSSKSKSKDSDTAKGYHSKGKDSEATLKDGDSTKDYGSKGKKLDAKVKDPTKEESEAILDKAEKKEAAEKKAQIEEIAALKVAEDEAVAAHNKATYGPTKSSVTVNSGGNVISFDAETFMASVTMSKELWFVKFYAPWCHHCQAMAPNWQQLGKDMKGRLNIGEVDCEANGRLCKDVNVQSYPTLLLFKGGQRVEYQGLRGLGDFVSYAEKAIEIGSGVKDVTATELREMEEMEDVIFIYFYDHATTIEDFKALDKLTLNLVNHAKIVKTDSAILADRYKITTWPRLVVSRSGRPTYFTPLAPYEMRDYGNVLHWMQTVWQPLVPELTAYNAREIMDGKIVVLGLLSRERPDEFMMAKNEIKTAALEWMDKQTQQFQLERQELRDAKQLRIEEAEDRNDQRALRNAKTIRINMDRSDRKEVVFAWVDGVFWERWIRTTYGIAVKNEGEKVVINDEDVCLPSHFLIFP